MPTERLTMERIKEININPDGFLWPEEEKLFLHILRLNEKALAFEEKDRGTLRQDYFSDYIMPTVDHTPWEFKNIPIPPGIRDFWHQMHYHEDHWDQMKTYHHGTTHGLMT